MVKSEQGRMEDEIERLRKALDAETGRCLEVQKQLDRASAEFEEEIGRASVGNDWSSGVCSSDLQGRMEDEIERLRKALDAETGRCLEVQKQLDRASAEFEE